MVFGCFAGAPGRGFGCLTVHCLNLGLQKVTLEVGFLTPFGT